MNANIAPLKIDNYLKAVLDNLKPLETTYLYKYLIRDILEKTDNTDVGYGHWISNLLDYIFKHHNLEGVHVLDIGCGQGELAVRMACLGYQVYGLDVHEKNLEFARMIALENGVSPDMFILNIAENLPFENNSFDFITMFSVLEHIDKHTAEWLIPEIYRISRGVTYVLVPNRLKLRDDHTGLPFIPWMPRWLALLYLKTRGYKYNYHISRSKEWDVFYRSFSKIRLLFKQYGFDVDFLPKDFIFPPLYKRLQSKHMGNVFSHAHRRLFNEESILSKTMGKMTFPKEAFCPYLNLIFIPQKNR